MRISNDLITNIPVEFDCIDGSDVTVPTFHPEKERTEKQAKDAMDGKHMVMPLVSSSSDAIVAMIGEDGCSVDVMPVQPALEGTAANITAMFTHSDKTSITVGPLHVIVSSKPDMPSGHFNTLNVTTRPFPNPWGTDETKEENAVHVAHKTLEDAEKEVAEAEKAAKAADDALKAAKKAEEDAHTDVEDTTKVAAEKAEHDELVAKDKAAAKHDADKAAAKHDADKAAAKVEDDKHHAAESKHAETPTPQPWFPQAAVKDDKTAKVEAEKPAAPDFTMSGTVEGTVTGKVKPND